MSIELDNLVKTRHSNHSLRLVSKTYDEVFGTVSIWGDGDQAGFIPLEVSLEALQSTASKRGFTVTELEGERRADDKSKVFIVHRQGEVPRSLTDVRLYDFKGDGSLLLENMDFDNFKDIFLDSSE